MPKVEFVQHHGARILILDVSNSPDEAANVAAFQAAQELVGKEPLKSVRLLTDVSGTHYSSQGVDVMKAFSKAVTPQMRASAAVGITGLKRVIVMSLNALTGRTIRMFDAREAALDWLAGQ